MIFAFRENSKKTKNVMDPNSPPYPGFHRSYASAPPASILTQNYYQPGLEAGHWQQPSFLLVNQFANSLGIERNDGFNYKEEGDNADYEYVEKDTDLTCSLCLSILSDPLVHSSCGNMFCKLCCWHLDRCPLCREPWKPSYNSYPPPLYVKNKLNQFKVKCNHCNAITTKGEFTTHKTKFCLVNCPAQDADCLWIGRPSEYHNHISSCAFLALKSHILEFKNEIKILQQSEKDLKDRVSYLEGLLGFSQKCQGSLL
jgi:hypothetical protein